MQRMGVIQLSGGPWASHFVMRVFQRLIERVLAGLNPPEGPAYVVVYIDDVLVFSQTLKDHLHHLHRVIHGIHDAGLKLKPVHKRGGGISRIPGHSTRAED